MTPLQLLEKLAQLELDPSVLGKIRKQIEDPAKEVKTTAVLKYLVKKKQITESQARSILKNGSKPSPPKAPPAPKYNTEDLTADVVTTPKPVVPAKGNDKTELDVFEAAPDVELPFQPEPQMEAAEVVELESAAVIPDQVYDYAGDAGFDNVDTYVAPSAESQIPKTFTGKKDRGNQWLSKWPYIAFFVIAMLMIFGVLLFSNVWNAKPDEKYKAAEKNFIDGSYQAAEKGFREYLEDHPSHTHATKAKARRVQCLMASAYATKNWEETIRRGETLLPELKADEESEMELIRDDVALMLTRSLDEHTSRLVKVDELASMESGLNTATQYKKLTDDPVYVPSSKRKSPTIKRHLDNIDNNLQTVAGSIQKEKDYAKALGSIRELGGAGETDSAFREFQTLTRNYGDLAARKELREAMLEISLKERELVKPEEVSVTVSNTLPPSRIGSTVVLGSTTGEVVESLRGEVVSFLVDGAVYGVDSGTGGIVWRKFVGFQSDYQPQRLDDESILICNLANNSLERVDSKTGSLVWRSEIGEPFLPPSITETTLAVTTKAGVLMTIDPASGAVQQAARLPQAVTVNPMVAIHDPLIYQPGSYSNLYVMSKDDLSCKEVFYLGHYKGSIVTPPFSFNGLILVVINGGDYAELHVLKPDEGGLNLKRVQAFRVANGPVTTPIQKLRRSLLVVADNGEMQVLEYNQGDDAQPIGKVANGKFDNGDGEQAYVTTEGSNVWIAGKGALRYKIQLSTGQFDFVDIKEHADYFVCPSTKLDDKMFFVRRRDGSGMISASLTDAMSMKPYWRTDFGGRLGSDLQSIDNGLLAVSNQGDLFKIDANALEKKYIQSDARASDVVESLQFSNALSVGNQIAYVGGKGNKDLMLVDSKQMKSQLLQLMAPSDQPACPPIAIGNDLLVANSTGQVARVNAKTGGMIGEMFQPPVRPSESIDWLRPKVVNEGLAVIAAAGKRATGDIPATPGALYVLDLSDRQAVKSSGSFESSGNLVGELAVDRSNVVVVERFDETDTLLKMDVSSGQPAEAGKLQLPGAVVAGPWFVGSKLLVHLESDQLLCLDGNLTEQWRMELTNDRLACPPMDMGGLVLLFESGRMVRVDMGAGKINSEVDLGQPVSQRPVVVGSSMFFPGLDGTVHVVDVNSLTQ